MFIVQKVNAEHGLCLNHQNKMHRNERIQPSPKRGRLGPSCKSQINYDRPGIRLKENVVRTGYPRLRPEKR